MRFWEECRFYVSFDEKDEDCNSVFVDLLREVIKGEDIIFYRVESISTVPHDKNIEISINISGNTFIYKKPRTIEVISSDKKVFEYIKEKLLSVAQRHNSKIYKGTDNR